MILHYKPNVLVESLAIDECTIHRATSTTARWWLLWFYVARDSDGSPEDFAVPVNPNAGYLENGPGGKTWGLMQAASGLWLISPSINVLTSNVVEPGEHPVPSLWHHTPRIEGVPKDAPWIREAP